jgi:hypothetical protein
VKNPRVPPYLPFKSFLTALDQLAQATPNIIRKDVFPSHSGLLQGQVIGALKFFDLIDEHGVPKGDRLEKIALETTAQRRVSVQSLLKTAYADVTKLDPAKITPSQLDAAFDAYGITGDTKKKAKIFFLQAAKFAELKLSPLLMRRGRTHSTATKRKVERHQPRSVQRRPLENHRDGAMKTIELRSGATLTVTLTGDLLELNQADRDLVFAIIDQINSHKPRN